MDVTLSREAIENCIIAWISLGMIGMALTAYIAHKRGKDITTHKFQLKLLLGFGYFFVILPLFLSNLKLWQKIIVSIVAISGALLHYFGIDRLQKTIKNKYSKK